MAIYHLSMQIVSRSKGQSSVAAASYRSGEKLIDERTGETKFYQREVQPEAMILSPANAPEWVQDRQRLWNEVEKVEKRKDSQLAREINIALPVELSNEKQTELIASFAQKQFVDKGMVADIAIHRDDKNNPHAHIMLTMRSINENGFGKKNRDWNADFANSKENSRGFVKSSENCLDIREQWANHANAALERESQPERITHLSHKSRGLEILPTVHLGHVASAMEKSEMKSDRGDLNRERMEYNEKVVELAKYVKEKQEIAKRQEQLKKQKDFLTANEKVDLKKAGPVVKGYVSLEKIEDRRKQIDDWEKKIAKSEEYFDWKENAFEKAKGYFSRQQYLDDQIERHQKDLEGINWFNPLKIKENRAKKERIEKSIERLQDDRNFQEDQLNDSREKLKFTDRENFYEKSKEFTAEKQANTASVLKQKGEIREQRIVLMNAEKALKNAQIREVASHYPELKTAGAYLTYENAIKLKTLIEKVGEIVPINKIESSLNARKEFIEKHEKVFKKHDETLKNANLAETYFRKLNEIEKTIQKTENNPLLKGKLLFSKEAKVQHEKDLQLRDQYKAAIEKIGYKDEKQLSEHKGQLDAASSKREKLEMDVKDIETGNYKGGHGVSSGLLDAVLQAVQQAQQQEVRAQTKRERERKRGRSTKEWGLER